MTCSNLVGDGEAKEGAAVSDILLLSTSKRNDLYLVGDGDAKEGAAAAAFFFFFFPVS